VKETNNIGYSRFYIAITADSCVSPVGDALVAVAVNRPINFGQLFRLDILEIRYLNGRELNGHTE
jgi:hypothetical protein